MSTFRFLIGCHEFPFEFEVEQFLRLFFHCLIARERYCANGFLSGCEFAGRAAHSLRELRVIHGKAGFPGFVDTEEGERAAGKREIFGEVDHLIHLLVGIFFAPEVVHDGRNSGEKAENRYGPELGLDAEQQAGSAGDERDGRQPYCEFRLGDAFGSGIGRHGFCLAQVIDAVVEEESAEYDATDKKRCFHEICP